MGHVRLLLLLGRSRRMDRMGSCPTSGRCRSRRCLARRTRNYGRLVDVRSTRAWSCRVAGRQRVKVLRCRTINKV